MDHTKVRSLAAAVLFSVILVGCSSTDDPVEVGRGPTEGDFILSITWTGCKQLARQGADFSVSTGRTSSSVSTHMDGGFEKQDCDEPMELVLPEAESYEFEVEGDRRTWSYEELEEQDFHITW